MKRIVLLLLSLLTLVAFKVMSSPFPADLMVGFATMNGGTTGGQGGTVITVSTFADFKTYAETANTPYIILVSGHLTSGDDKGAMVKVHSNKTIIGIGSDAFLDGIGLYITSRKNIIIRNLKFTMISITNTTDPAVYSPLGDEGRPQILVNGGDCIRISNGQNIWIDHCELYAIDPAVQTNQDLYDGLIDASSSSKYITISWCYFHDHHKSSLIGSSDTDNYDRLMTFHHNRFSNVEQRTPSYRFGHAHIFNNYYFGPSDSGVNSRMGACLKVEGNSFENFKNPIITTATGIAGLLDLSDNLYINSTGSKPTSSTCSYTVPYDYSLLLQPSVNVKDTVLKYAGVGIVANQDYQAGLTSITSPANNSIFPNLSDITINADASAGTATIIKVQFFEGSNLLGVDSTGPYTYDWNDVAPGTYSITAVLTDNKGQTTTSVAKSLTVNVGTGILGSSHGAFTEIYPNPSNEVFIVKPVQQIKHLWITDIYGKLVAELHDIQSGQQAEIGKALPEGTYVLMVEYASDKIEVTKLIKIK